MASAAHRPTDEAFQCSICIEDYTRPRKLPICGHTFCEECLLAYVRKLKDTRKISGGFSCPLCRGTNATAKELKDSRKWINKLEIDVEFVAKLNASTKNDMEFCGPCLGMRQFSKIKLYCLECREMLCKGCSSIHQINKSSSQHRFINFDEGPTGNKQF